MKTLRLGAALALLLAVPSSATAQAWKAELAAEQVTEADGKYTYEEAGLLETQVPGYEHVRAQLKITSEAPADGSISRDNFVSITTSVLNALLLTAFSEGYTSTASVFLGSVKYRELEALIGEPDLEINIRMTAEGLQHEVIATTSGDTQRATMTWGEFYTE